MRTEDLIRALAADPVPEPGTGRSLLIALVLGALVSLSGFLVALGPRPDLAAAFSELHVILKPILGLVLGFVALGAVLASARPGARTDRWTRALLVAPGLAALAVIAECLQLPVAEWTSALLGGKGGVLTCLVSIPLIALPVLAGSLLALRRGANLNPARTGALAGLLSGGIAVAIYAPYCIEDSPLFYATWYSVAVLAVTAFGASLGARLLRF